MSEIIQNLLDQLSSEAISGYMENLEPPIGLQLDELIAKYEAIINLDPENKYRHSNGNEFGFVYDALSALAELYIQKKEYEKARKAILRSLELLENFKDDELYVYFKSDDYWLLGRVHYLLGQYDEALAYLEISLKLSSNYQAFYFMCLCYRKKGALKEAMTNLKMAKTLKAVLYRRFNVPGGET